MKGLIPWSFALLLSVGSLLLPAFAEEKATGHYYWEREVESFIPCGSDNAFWVLGEKSVLQPLRDKVSKLGDHQPIYVEVTGHFEDNADSEGAAADYDGLYRIESVIASTPDSPATCPVLVMGD
ncbi:Uncharacterised protein [Aeromonas encheleia]|uniref:hypothetical protein n=1 Tax=Aeromonas TaxID=642 RepID=UPI0005B1FFCA|nr:MULTISPECIES: hypothetical protein [Aeromonas]MBV7597873.1 hypothetical protein [Aeromonas sp. sia0103]UNP90148.1 hypothetical protein MNZ22_07885 [Aeromonas encheleia]VEG96537.1 Uncharacterised protein [Aeromonas encheleia]